MNWIEFITEVAELIRSILWVSEACCCITLYNWWRSCRVREVSWPRVLRGRGQGYFSDPHNLWQVVNLIFREAEVIVNSTEEHISYLKCTKIQDLDPNIFWGCYPDCHGRSHSFPHPSPCFLTPSFTLCGRQGLMYPRNIVDFWCYIARLFTLLSLASFSFLKLVSFFSCLYFPFLFTSHLSFPLR